MLVQLSIRLSFPSVKMCIRDRSGCVSLVCAVVLCTAVLPFRLDTACLLYTSVEMVDPGEQGFLSRLENGNYDVAFIALHG